MLIGKFVDQITWNDIYNDFKISYPTLSKHVVSYEPYCYATIKVFIPNVGAMIYNYDSKKATFVN